MFTCQTRLLVSTKYRYVSGEHGVQLDQLSQLRVVLLGSFCQAMRMRIVDDFVQNVDKNDGLIPV